MRIMRDGPDVLGALELRGGGAIFLAHTTLKLLDGFVFVIVHPGNQFAFDDPDLADAMTQQRGAQHGGVGAGQKHF